ncbi:Uncharacterized protein conserved in archaea [Archaeoglobus sulfaticallidus PM70-1]|uniref:GTP-dependent dephospho-CoA kinase n=1 Tax=Archaeoglobus sulfaticallidus PM70-1 TaxID=387631 RepID=N0BI48_9EURY|nr:GTP-dependent dephospho-CoA kinase family protein [Archaeoglobus sulfaticallidus]AGK60121.1 Uncharacterized protein conserved in archaea [Archaeoglobus sulfaticallidus PM70-1]
MAVKGLKLPDSLRDYLAKPHGRLYTGKGEDTVEKIEELGKYSPLICVGDLVTYYIFKAGYNPDIVVIDFKTIRNEIDEEVISFIESKTEGYVRLDVVNPQAYITLDLVEKLIEAVSLLPKKVLIVVEGEEDLAVLPLVYMLPLNSLLLYGQPREGIVAVVISEEKKNIIPDILQRMEKLEDGDLVMDLVMGEGSG